MNMLNHLSYTLLPVEVFLGNTKRTIGELKKLKVGNTLLLDKLTGEPLDVFINGKQKLADYHDCCSNSFWNED